MNYEEAVTRAKEITEKFRQRASHEFEEQMVSGNVASILSYSVGKAINEVTFYLQTHNVCSQAQFLRALEIVLRNEAAAVKEQVELFAHVDEDQEDGRGPGRA